MSLRTIPFPKKVPNCFSFDERNRNQDKNEKLFDTQIFFAFKRLLINFVPNKMKIFLPHKFTLQIKTTTTTTAKATATATASTTTAAATKREMFA